MARIHSFQSLGTVDGPGVRFVVFMQGCALRCPYCHNPDTWDMNGGKEYSVQQVLDRILRVRGYLSGGVTVSGGEPLLQADFVAELFEKLHEHGIHCCLDTSGYPLPENLGALLSNTDLVLLDVKASDAASHKERFGLSIDEPLAFLRHLEKRGIKTWVRHVVVPGINDDLANLDRLAELLRPFSVIKKVEILPFHKLCIEKYEEMGLEFPYKALPAMDKEKALSLQAYINKKLGR